LPIWHGIKREEITRYSPLLADRLAAKTENGIDSVVKDIEEVLSHIPNKSSKPPLAGSENGGHEREETITILLRTIRDDYNENKRNEAARKLRGFTEPRVVDALLDAVEHDPKVRYEALVSLFELKSEKSVDTFLYRLEDRSGRIRRISVRALGEMGTKLQLKPLMELIFSYDHKNREIKRPKGKGWTNNWGKIENVQPQKRH